VSLIDLRGREDEPEVRDLLALARVPGEWLLVGWEENGRLVACAGLQRDDTDIVVRSIVVAASGRGRGVGRSLLDAVAGVATARRLVAESDDDAVGFFERCGFTAEEVEPEGGRRRFRCSRSIGAGAAPPEAVRAITLGDLEQAIRSCWDRETSDDPDEWSEANPARGQCAATALLIRDLLGGEILIANVLRDGERVERHAWNRLPSGVSVDLTRSQFSNGEEYEEPVVGEPLPASGDRFELLAKRVRDRLSF
jgi:GNAT superfamily N-acetyltransferase